MELGQTVCVARTPDCGACPIADLCEWRAAGYPVYEGRRSAVQKKYEGSDRQVRGLVLRELRGSDTSVPVDVLGRLWPDAEQLSRALGGLVRDGLVVRDGPELRLPE